MVAEGIRAGIASILVLERYNVTLSTMELGHNANTVGFLNCAGLSKIK